MTASVADSTMSQAKISSRLSQPARFLIELLSVGEQTPARPAEQVEHFIGWAKRNKIPLKALAGRCPLWLDGDPAFVAAVDAEEAWYRTQRDEYLRVREAWRARGIDCLMIKPAGNPPSFPHTSDSIDILVRPDDGVAARETLREMGYVE